MKKKSSLIIMTILGALVLVIGSLAYFSQDLIANNELKTGKYDTSIIEEFIPTNKWSPGVEINKQVAIENKGDVDVVVRVSLSELWQRNKDIMNPNNPEEVLSYKGEILGNTFDDETGKTQATVIKNFANNVYEYEAVKDDLANYHNKWIHYNEDYYYLGVIGAKQTSNNFLESVTMNPLLDTFISGSNTVVSANDEGIKTVTKNYTYGKYGYDSANYTLSVKAITVQASKSAIVSVLGDDMLTAYLANNFATIKETH